MLSMHSIGQTNIKPVHVNCFMFKG